MPLYALFTAPADAARDFGQAFPLNYLNPRGLNSDGRLVFRVDPADGRRVVVRADPDSQ